MNYMTSIEEINWTGDYAVKFCSGGYEAIIIPSVGANVISLKYKPLELDVLRTPVDINELKAAPQVFGIPVLFPPNRIQDGTFTVNGRVYKFKINHAAENHFVHGYLHSLPWKIKKMNIADDNTAIVEASFFADKNTMFFSEFPHVFEIKLLYRLSASGLEQKVFIKNCDRSSMPLGLGFHTSFKIPFDNASYYRLIVSAGDKWEIGARTLPTGTLIALNGSDQDLRGEGIYTQGSSYFGHFTSKPFENSNFSGAIIKNISSGIGVVYRTSNQYGHWVIWNANGTEGFICLEPQTWAINAPNINLPDDITGFQLMPSNAVWEGFSGISVKLGL